MKTIKLLAVTLLALFISVPAMSQGTSLSTAEVENPKFQMSNFEKFATEAGQYVEFQSVEAVVMKIGSASTLGGYTLRCEKITDMASGKSAQAIKVTPNSATGIGKLVSGATGIGRASQVYYIDVDELPAIQAHIEKMIKFCEAEPAINTTVTYTTRGGFSFSIGYVVNAKKAVKLGQLGQTGEMPFGDFTAEMSKAFNTAKEKLSLLK